MVVVKAMITSMMLSLGFVIGPRILFVGNSHTSFGDVPGTVQRLLRGEAGFEGVDYKSFGVGTLNQWKGNSGLVGAVKSGGWSFAVLQGAEVSSSHRYTYSQANGIDLARRLERSGTQVFLVSEWPRRGWNETDYIEAIYRTMAKDSGAEVVPVGRVWDGTRKRLSGFDLWQADGNHASAAGSYLSARTIASWLGGEKMAFLPAGIDRRFVKAVDEAIYETLGK